MAYQIEDEYGTIWYIGKGDPAYGSVLALRNANYTYIVLPRGLILDGKIPEEFSYIGENSLKRNLRLMECVVVLSD